MVSYFASKLNNRLFLRNMPESENSEVAHVRKELLEEGADVFFTVEHVFEGGYFLV